VQFEEGFRAALCRFGLRQIRVFAGRHGADYIVMRSAREVAAPIAIGWSVAAQQIGMLIPRSDA
jgi:hypothetical protein